MRSDERVSATEVVFGCAALVKLVCSYLPLSVCQELRLASKRLARFAFDAMLDRFVFLMWCERDNDVEILDLLPRVPALVSDDVGRAHLYEGCRELFTWTNDELDAAFPSTLKSLDICGVWLPRFRDLRIEEMTFVISKGDCGPLPESLKCLVLDVQQGTSLPRDLPPRLEYFRMRGSSTDPLPRFPETLRHLEFSWFCPYNHPLDPLPPRLETLTLGYFYNKPINAFPPTLRVLMFNHRYFGPVDNLPESLVELAVDANALNSFERLPRGLRYLRLYATCTRELEGLPPSLEHLSLCYYNLPLKGLPKGLKVLDIMSNFDQPLDDLPDSLLVLHPGDKFNRRPTRLPPSLLVLDLGLSFDQILEESVLPKSLAVLNVANQNYSAPLPRSVCERLRVLRVPTDLKQPSIEEIEGLSCEVQSNMRVYRSKSTLPIPRVSFDIRRSKRYYEEFFK